MTFDVKACIFDTQVSKSRFDMLLGLLNDLDLRGVLHLLNIKYENSFQSYHNYQHLISVALICHDAAEYHKLTQRDTTLLMLAALYHDFGHSGKKELSDVLNVSRSIVKAEHALRVIEPELDDEAIGIILKLILVTENTHLVVAGTRLERIIVDADILQNLEEDGKQWLAGLKDELDVEADGHTTKVFLRAKCKTEWAKEKIAHFDFTALD
jgi:hypothetical protein